jgi:hypothetical protein
LAILTSGGNFQHLRALRRRKAEYDEARRLSDGSDSCWSDPDGDSDNESTPELDIGPPAPEEAEVGAVVVGEEVATLQHQDSAAEHRKRVQREEQIGGVKRRGGQGGAGQAGGKKRRQRQRRASQKQTGGKWHLEGFSTSPGGTKPVDGSYAVGVVESQVWVQGTTDREAWLGVKLVPREQGECHRVDIQRKAAETGGWKQQVAGQAERERQGRVDDTGSQMGGKQWGGSCNGWH